MLLLIGEENRVKRTGRSSRARVGRMRFLGSKRNMYPSRETVLLAHVPQ